MRQRAATMADGANGVGEDVESTRRTRKRAGVRRLADLGGDEVMLLLTLTVLSPLELYTSSLLAPVNLIRKLLFEHVGIVFSEESGRLSKESTGSEGQGMELPSKKAGEHKSRALIGTQHAWSKSLRQISKWA